MVKNNIKCLDISKTCLLDNLRFSGSLETKCMLLNNEQCKTKPFLIDLILAELKYYPFMITLDKCNGNCNIFIQRSSRICVPNKRENLNLNIFNLIAKTNE